MFALLLIILQVQGGEASPVIVQQSASWTTVAIALIGIVPSSIAAIIAGMALLQGRQNAVVAMTTDRKVDTALSNGNTIIEKATEIHQLTNSNLSRVTQQLEAANVRIEGFATAQGESTRKIEKLETLLEQLARNVIPGPSKNKSPVSDEPLPVHDEEAVGKLDELIKQTDPKKGGRK